MPPPGLLAAPRSGGTTSPSKSELIGAARVILDNCGVQFSQIAAERHDADTRRLMQPGYGR